MEFTLSSEDSIRTFYKHPVPFSWAHAIRCEHKLSLDDKMQVEDIMGWPKCSFGFSISMFENSNELSG